MKKNNVVFITPMLFGHTNRTIKLAKLLLNKGYDVHYAGSVQLLRFIIKNNFKLYTLQTQPIQEVFVSIFTWEGLKEWFNLIYKNSFLEKYTNRKSELKILIDKLQPKIIFLDEFCYFDYIILLTLKPDYKIFILQGKMGMYFNENSPPGNSFSFPNKFTKYLWKFSLLRYSFKRFYKKCFLFGKTTEHFSKKILLSEQIKSIVQFNHKKIFTPSFNDVPELLLYPPEFDFPQNTILSWQQYLTTGVDLDRKELIPENLKVFIENAKDSPSNRIIYCSLGTVADVHLGKTKLKIRFLKKCLQIAANNKNYYFIISTGEDLNKEVHELLSSENALILTFVPQIFVLKNADIFLTHGGRNSIFEGIYTETPMLIFPLNNSWDQNGNAARAVFHNTSIKGNIYDSIEKLEEQIISLMNSIILKESIISMANKLKQKYTDEYLSRQLDSIIE